MVSRENDWYRPHPFLLPIFHLPLGYLCHLTSIKEVIEEEKIHKGFLEAKFI